MVSTSGHEIYHYLTTELHSKNAEDEEADGKNGKKKTVTSFSKFFVFFFCVDQTEVSEWCLPTDRPFILFHLIKWSALFSHRLWVQHLKQPFLCNVKAIQKDLSPSRLFFFLYSRNALR